MSLEEIAERMARSFGHDHKCRFIACTCGASEEQAEALTEYQRFKLKLAAPQTVVPRPLLEIETCAFNLLMDLEADFPGCICDKDGMGNHAPLCPVDALRTAFAHAGSPPVAQEGAGK